MSTVEDITRLKGLKASTIHDYPGPRSKNPKRKIRYVKLFFLINMTKPNIEKKVRPRRWGGGNQLAKY